MRDDEKATDEGRCARPEYQFMSGGGVILVATLLIAAISLFFFLLLITS